jgi:hypothetical protein
MRRLWIAVRAFFVVLFNGEVTRQVDEVLQRRRLAAPEAAPEGGKPEPKKKPEPKPPVRSEAVSLLAALQREARFVDFIKEPLGEYSDAQVAAAARDVHRDCGAVLERFFALAPVLGQPEGAEVEVPAGYDAGRFRITGNVAGEPPYRGRLVHHGWEATKCEVPAWSGKDDSARVVAPIEVELA